MAENKPFFYGGQAVIEGVMMRGAHKAAVAVRDPQGNIQVHEEPLNRALYRGRIAKTPFLRGLVGLWDALGLGTKALMWSAEVALDEEEEKARQAEKRAARGKPAAPDAASSAQASDSIDYAARAREASQNVFPAQPWPGS
ncbi:MAG: DUF1385 domain-containing protein [Anaerolineae bacterium]|nr:DUF1385 domain-containing protein [Anaerolineae bacterium]